MQNQNIDFPLDFVEKIVEIGTHNHVPSKIEISSKILAQNFKDLVENISYNTHAVYFIATQSTAMNELSILNKRNVYDENIQNLRKRKSIIVDVTKNLQ